MLLQDKTLRNLLKLTLVATIIFLLLYATSVVLDIRIKEKSYVSQKIISGRGTAEIKATPDVATFSYTIKKINKNLSDSQQQMQKIAQKALEILEENGVAKSDIKTTNYSAYPEYEMVNFPCEKGVCPPSKQNLRGFVATQSYVIKVRNIEKASQIINQLTEAGVEEVGGLNFVIDSIENLKYQARMQAIVNAKKEALSTAKALNVTLKRIVKYHDEENYYQPYAMQRMATTAYKGSYVEVQPGEEVVRSSVEVTYEFE